MRTTSKFFNHDFTINSTTFEFVLLSVQAELGELPLTLNEFDKKMTKAKTLLKKYFDINLTNKKKNKARDFFAEIEYDLEGGFQQYLAIRKETLKDTINILEYAKTLPEQLYLSRNDDEDSLMLCIEPENIDFHISKYSFRESDKLTANEDNEYFRDLTTKELDSIGYAYVLNELIIDTGNPSYGSSSGFGDYKQDLEYIKDNFGIKKKESGRFEYFAVNSEDRAIMVMNLFRANNQVIDSIIDELKKIEQYL